MAAFLERLESCEADLLTFKCVVVDDLDTQ